MSDGRPFLLVIDPNPETAAGINSSLRNAGINVHILHADRLAEADRMIREFKPFMLLYMSGSRYVFPVIQAATLAEQYQLSMAIQIDQHDQDVFNEALQTTSCIGISNEEQLQGQVKRLSILGEKVAQETQLRSQEEELESRLNLLMDSTSDPIAYFHAGLHVAANQAYLKLLGMENFDEVETLSLLDIIKHDTQPMKELIQGFGRNEFPDDHMEYALHSPVSPGQTALPVHLHFAAVRYNHEDCVQMRVELMKQAEQTTPLEHHQSQPGSNEIADIEEHEQAEQKTDPAVESMPGDSQPDAETDPLTGMLTRSAFMTRLSKRLESISEKERGALFYIRIDDSEDILSTCTTREMDQFVTLTANEILTSAADVDELGRFDDMTYVVFGTRATAASHKQLGEKICAGIDQLKTRHPEVPVPKSCSIGMVLLDLQDHGAEHTFANARSAWKLAAEQSNCMVRFKPARLAGVSDDEEAHWIERLKYAIESDDFYTVQREVMSLEGDNEGICENRTFMHEDHQDLNEYDFMPPAERNQLASQIDRHVIPGLLRTIGDGDERHMIRISGNSLQDFSFPSWFQRQLQESGVNGRNVILQFPAWAAIQQTKSARRLMDELTVNGCSFALSDADEDPKLLDTLKELNFQFITLTSALTTDLQSNPKAADKIRNVVQTSESENTLAMATDIPSSNELAILWQCGVKLVSGEFMQETSRVVGQ